MSTVDFKDYQLSDELLKAIKLLNYKNPTKVQAKVIPAVLEQRDVIVKSQTGSGKTAAFAIPISELVDWEENKPQALILAPTRELAIQVKEEIFNIGRFKRLKVAAIYGKFSMEAQIKQLKQKTHVVVGTPGRVIDHIERGTLDTSEIKYLVLDEADEMLNMGFIEQIETIINSIQKERVTLLLSATMPKNIESLCNKYMKDPLLTEIEEESKPIDRIVQEGYLVEQTDKLSLLNDLLIIENADSCIIFCNTIQMVETIYSELRKSRVTCKQIHGDMEQRDRVRVMNDFRQGLFRYLIATDVAARGIDIDHISLVINYDVPRDRESYVHRIGRTGRINREGRAITLITKNDGKFISDIETYIDRTIEIKERPDKETVRSLKPKFFGKMNTRPEVKEIKGAELSKDIMKLHINAGKKTRMRPVDIVGTLCSIEGMTADDIGIINIVDVSTFFEVLNNKGELVYKALQKKPVKGRLRKVSKVEE